MCFNQGANSFNCALGSFTYPCNITYNLKRIGSKIRVVTQLDNNAIYIKI